MPPPMFFIYTSISQRRCWIPTLQSNYILGKDTSIPPNAPKHMHDVGINIFNTDFTMPKVYNAVTLTIVFDCELRQQKFNKLRKLTRHLVRRYNNHGIRWTSTWTQLRLRSLDYLMGMMDIDYHWHQQLQWCEQSSCQLVHLKAGLGGSGNHKYFIKEVVQTQIIWFSSFADSELVTGQVW